MLWFLNLNFLLDLKILLECLVFILNNNVLLIIIRVHLRKTNKQLTTIAVVPIFTIG